MKRTSIPSSASPPTWLPSDYGAAAWTYDPGLAVNTQALTGGTVYLAGILLRSARTISTLWTFVSTIATTPTAGQNFMGLYSVAGTLLSSGATSWTPTGARSTALDAPQACAAGQYWVAFLANAATPPTLLRGTGTSGSPTVYNFNLAAAVARFAVNGTGQTTLPSSITPASNITSGAATLWAAVS